MSNFEIDEAKYQMDTLGFCYVREILNELEIKELIENRLVDSNYEIPDLMYV